PTGKNIPFLEEPLEELATDFGIETSSFKSKIEPIRKKLLAKREQRIHPLLDDKILTDWNGLIIAALAKAGRAFQNETYTKLASTCWQFICNHLFKNGELKHRWRKGEAAIGAFADDYVFLIWGLIELYESTF